MRETQSARGAEIVDISEMWIVYWEHEYYTDDDQASFISEADAKKFAAQLQEKGKRRVQIFAPGE